MDLLLFTLEVRERGTESNLLFPCPESNLQLRGHINAAKRIKMLIFQIHWNFKDLQKLHKAGVPTLHCWVIAYKLNILGYIGPTFLKQSGHKRERK